MNHTESLTRYVANFVDELYQSGLRDVVISPGSRSTPLAMTFATYPHITHWINMDERSAAFFALGIAKQTQRPVALVCTSGTAAANYYPAVIEAYYSRVPLLILTADRPHELRDVGAPQAINQTKLYGDYVKWFHDMGLPEPIEGQVTYVRGKAARAFHIANTANRGVVQLNFPFREPLVPDFSMVDLWGLNQDIAHLDMTEGKKQLTDKQLTVLHDRIKQHENGVIVCGLMEDQRAQEAITALAKFWGIPLFADPLSQLRSGSHDKTQVIESYDAILKHQETRDRLRPDFIIRFGAMPVSKPYTLWLKENPNTDHYIVEEVEGYREPIGHQSTIIHGEPKLLCEALLHKESPRFNQSWLKSWQEYNEIAVDILAKKMSETLTEGHVVNAIAKVIPDNSVFYVGNSMAIRDVDTFWFHTDKQIRILANRGANGIDGVTSSALGTATSGKRVTLLIGDLSFFHDQNGLLLTKHYTMDITIVLLNNNGGGIFSFLPQAKQEVPHFEALFGTPMNLDFLHIANLYQASYYNPSDWDALQSALTDSYQIPGLSLIEVKTNRAENATWHEDKWKEIAEQLKGESDVSDSE
ncbi:2-succinyl-5-enolpyruvyl-6-hydroxy-3-cyclohexene-1-carboxylate synthase [Paraliobacillus quinghaiensis]|uniref:2-succinyl-5-enolpyruvyl-6-hydroxy-3-cyclohexene-1-carboxylate synthase n=1 Tax=Paraliobacillus quinghaiensis TaxID=470815 RepID=A0A917WXF8_9BACI|nr:2-succinyl-5-enolpyruvyl-6-hydroxy-3-cyclohexene-1-carboxylic-acid synthase [Paraliobacillus quinghaiensis]GGM37018.1 2-succinyl-5-enolpyruvyl-6-hydroxy-3-cyclohexene-1-carboxylate synthase [Paraliobacillus quinghaiensis]